MIIAWDNKIDAGIVTAGSQVSSLPATNVQLALLALKWGTAAAVKSSFLLFDLGSSLSCAILAVLGSNLTPTATMRLRASVTDPTATGSLVLDTGTIAAGVAAGYGAIYYPFNAVAARYWRLDLADASLVDNMLVGRVVLAPVWKPSNGQLYEWTILPNDPSQISKSYGGQAYADIRPQLRELDFTLDFLSESEMFGNAFALARANGVVKDVLAIPFETGARISEQSVWGLCKASRPISHRLSQIFRQDFTIEERL